MQSSSTFMTISGPIMEVKKSAVINDWENISYWEEPEQSKENKFCLGGVATQENFVIFTPI